MANKGQKALIEMNAARTQRERSEAASKAGKASAAKRAARKEIREYVLEYLDEKDGAMRKKLAKAIVDRSLYNLDWLKYMMLLIKEAPAENINSIDEDRSQGIVLLPKQEITEEK